MQLQPRHVPSYPARRGLHTAFSHCSLVACRALRSRRRETRTPLGTALSRRLSLSLVSKSWAHALRGPGPVWRVVFIGGRSDAEDEPEQAPEGQGNHLDDLALHAKKQLKAAALHAWFTNRTG